MADPNELRWHLNSSFSPPPSSRYLFANPLRPPLNQPINETGSSSSYGPLRQVNEIGSSLGTRSSQFGSDRNHHHSVSDGALSYFGSPAESRWNVSTQRFDLGELSTPSTSARPETPYHRSAERSFIATSSFGSASPMYPPPHTRYSTRRSFMSKPVYPLSFQNPVSSEPELSSPDLSPDLKFQKLETGSSSRYGFRFSNASSYEESVDIPMDENPALDSRVLNLNPLRGQKCGLCERMLWQKSPWSSNRLIRNADMPTCGVLPCRHVFHADCLEENVGKGENHDPICPLCDNGFGSVSVSEPLQVALQGLRRSQTLMREKEGFKSRFFKLRGRIGKDLFNAGRVWKRVGSSSKNPRDDRGG